MTVGDTASGCSEGGITVEVEGSAAPHEVCNGEAGAPGQTGYSEYLPVGKTETGAWNTPAQSPLLALVSFSFNIRLPAAIATSNVIVEAEGFAGVAGESCPGSVTAPAAEPGYLCIYTSNEPSSFHGLPAESTEAGVVVTFVGVEDQDAWGTWAVTAD